MSNIERTELWTVRSEIRRRAVTDPVEVAHHVIALEGEVLALRQQLHGAVSRYRVAEVEFRDSIRLDIIDTEVPSGRHIVGCVYLPHKGQ